MSIKQNVIANYISQIYITVIGMVAVPLYIKHMGVEAYGLVSFFSMLQVWFTLIDLGLSPMISRETARFRGGAVDIGSFKRLLRGLEYLFYLLGIIGCGLLLGASGFIARNWLKASKIPETEIIISLQLFSIIVALRWISGLYRAVIFGSEKIVWISVFNSAVGTLRFLMVLPVLLYFGPTPKVFFGYQVGTAVVEFVCLLLYAYKILPYSSKEFKVLLGFETIKPLIRFSMTIAFTSFVWVLITQTDKLVLSKILPLSEYSYFTIAVLAASGTTMISGPISNAIMPRMAKLEAQADHSAIISLYRKSTQAVAIIGGAVSFTLAFCAESVLYVWTGDSLIAQRASAVLAFYALGNGILVLSAFPYYLQYAKGDLRMHFFGNAIFVVLLIPTIIWATERFGSIGAGAVWLGLNFVVFVAWLPIVHNKFARGLNANWYIIDILNIQVPMLIIAIILNRVLMIQEGRGLQAVRLCIIGLTVLLTGAICSSDVRSAVSKIKSKPFYG